jgi:hypothetical protein
MARARLRWGLPDVVLAWFAGAIGAAILVSPLYDSSRAADEQSVWFLLGTIALQNGLWVAAMKVISNVKGQHSLRRDFGLDLSLQPAQLRAFGVWVLAGVGVAIVGSLLLAPFNAIGDFEDQVQDVANALDRSTGIGRALFALSVVTIVPLGEELIFRGGIQRALQRRFRAEVAVFSTAAIFAVSHALGDPGSYPALPALLLVGLVSGYQAHRTGDLTRSIAIHSGFNLLAALQLVR